MEFGAKTARQKADDEAFKHKILRKDGKAHKNLTEKKTAGALFGV